MKKAKKFAALLMAGVTAFAFSSCTAKNVMGEKVSSPTSLSVQKTREREKKQGDVFVSPNGDDSNSGTKESPVKTVQKALELARKINKEEKVISFAEGEYEVKAVTLTEQDSNVTFYAENEVVFNGGMTLKSSDFEEYDGNIKVLDLSKYGVTAEDIGQVRAFGQYNQAEKYGESGSLYCELFCGNERMTLARYPNEGEYLKTGKIIDNGDSREIYTNKGTQVIPEWDTMTNPRGGTFAADKEVTDRVKSWQKSDDIWLFGYFQYDWADSTTPLKEVKDSSITTKYASVYGFKEGMPYYFFNVFEELDAPNEWYIDRENLKLYFYMTEENADKPMTLSLEKSDLITIDGAKNVTIDGITMTGTRAGAIKGKGDRITVKNCLIKNVGENAVDLEGTENTVENNEITATGKGGIVLKGGDKKTLTSGKNVAANNLIHDWSQVYRTYQPAVKLEGVGGVCSHNEIYNSSHEAIAYSGCNHIIEYNVLHDVVRESSDAGAIYAGRSWSDYGNKVRYNCIYNIGSKDFAASGIYFDDALSGQEAYGNLLVNIPGNAFLIGGGRDNKIENNIVVNAATAFWYDDRAIAGIEDGGWFAHAVKPNEGLWATLNEVDVNSKVWKESFPSLSQVTTDFDNTSEASFAANPSNSTLKNNVVVNEKKSLGGIAKRVKKYSDVSDNTLYKMSDDVFESDGVYKLKQTPENFEQLPLEEMGRTYKTN